LNNTFYKPDYKNPFATITIPTSQISTARETREVDFGQDVIIPAGTEFIVVWE
jgi:hypothetical protein